MPVSEPDPVRQLMGRKGSHLSWSRTEDRAAWLNTAVLDSAAGGAA